MYDGLRFLFNLFSVSAFIGAGFTLGCMAICRVFRWAPANITVNVDATKLEI